jgi:hypothetical protein
MQKRPVYTTSFVPVTVQDDDKAALERSGYALREATRLFAEWAQALPPEECRRWRGISWTFEPDARGMTITLLERED